MSMAGPAARDVEASRAVAARTLLRCEGIDKRFGANHVLRAVDFSIDAGRIRGLVGENGAGKSTLMRVIAGVHAPDAGTVTLDGTPVRFAGADDALAARIVTIHQDINLVQTMTIAENVFLNNEPTRAFGLIRRAEMKAKVAALLDRCEIPARPDDLVSDLPNDLKKMVQIARAVAMDPKILLMDEPTSSLTDVEVKIVLRLMRTLAADGVGIVLISHYLNEIFEVCDDLTVMRDGRIVADGPVAETSLPTVVTQMIGRSLEIVRPERAARTAGAPLLEVDDLSVPGRLRHVSLTLREGEILGLTGLAGSGLTDLAKALFGAGERGPSGGRVAIAGRPAAIGGPADALKSGIALLTNDRLREGILPDFTLIDNVCLGVIDRYGVFSDRRAMRATTEAAIRRLRVRTRGPDAPARQLSGGNQQKVLLAKWLETTPRIFVLDEPTIGVDVGSKEEIRGIIREIVAGGVGVILITTELAELELLCDRVLVMFRGEIVASLEGDAVDSRTILQASVSGKAPTS